MKRIVVISLTIFSALFCMAQTKVTLEEDWKFTREDNKKSAAVDFDDSHWQTVNVPHDWAIYGPFGIENDKQNTAITQDGQKAAMEHAGRTGGLPFVGVGWYRKSFKLPEFEEGKRALLQFDGAMSHAQVFVNGQKVGAWPYGYNSFYFDITPYVKEGQTNILAVRLENFTEQSRWYPGAGLYRNVHLFVKSDVHIPIWGTYVTTPVVKEDYAKVNLKTRIQCSKKNKPLKIYIETNIKNDKGEVVATNEAQLSEYDEDEITQNFVVKNPELWDTEQPNLYKAVSKLYAEDKGQKILQDTYETIFGIRTIEILPNKGFFLNGKLTKFKGVCMHHDLGPLGAAVNDAAIRRQIRILKNMGVNAIRTSHNMPAPELVKACDEMGMMLMAESFDEWKVPKVKNGYHQLFDEWAEKDLINLIHHYRNNASVVMWCIGNEVYEQGKEGGSKEAYFLQNICHREDPTRPVTQGMDNPNAVLNNGFASVMEVAGFNYRPFKYTEAYAKLPQQIILGSETASTVSSRGVYKFPVKRKAMAKYDDHQSSSYDVEHCSWSNLPEDDFIQHEDLPYCIGEFVWTGFDYLGEPTPYYTDWPSHSSLFGIIDLAGIPKDRYYLYRSHWNKEKETLHILPHWNWKGREGKTTPVFVYTNYPTAELFINGVSQGKRTKNTTVQREGSYSKSAQESFERQKRYRLMWLDTKYEPGVLKVVAYDAQGNKKAEKELHTAGKPYKLVAEVDRDTLLADGKDLAFVRVKVVDREGNLCPNASHKVQFEVKGAGTYRAVANGNSASLSLFHLPEMEVFSGQLTAIVQAAKQKGEVTFIAKAKGLKIAKLKIYVGE